MKKGFTLVELIVVLAIISILAGLLGYYFYRGDSHLKKDVRVLYGNLQLAKIKAIQTKDTAYVEFDFTNNSYKVVTNSDGKTIVTMKLSSRVEYGDGGHSTLSNHKAAFGATNPPKAIFYPTGFCYPSGAVCLKLKEDDSKVYKITVSMGGNIKIERWDGSSFVE